MKLKDYLSNLCKAKIILLSLIGFSGCAGVKVKDLDVPVCKELLIGTAYCSWTISKNRQIVNDKELLYGKTWFQHRKYALSIIPEAWAPLKAAVTKVCHKHLKDCQDEGLDTSIDNIDELMDKTIQDLIDERKENGLK